MRVISKLILCVLFFGNMGVVHAADVHNKYKKPIITFNLPEFAMSYGDTGKLCAAVRPRLSASKISWLNSTTAPGVFKITPGTDSACGGGSDVSLTITSTMTACSPQGSVRAVLYEKPAGAIQGTVMLPDRITSSFRSAGLCDSNVVYNVRFASNEGTTPNFEGLPVHENWTVQPPNTCGMGGHQDSWIIGTLSSGGPAEPNSIDDGNGQCGLPPGDCSSLVTQTFTVGACTFPATPINITVQKQNGVASVTRSDCIGAHCVGGQ